MKKITLLFLMLFYTTVVYSQQNQTAEQILLTLNNATLSAYAQAKNTTQKTLSPVVIAKGNHLVVYQHGKRTQYLIVPLEYTELKTFAQLTLAMFAMTQNAKMPPLEALKSYRIKIIKAQDALPATSLSAAQQIRQKQIIHNTLLLIDDILDKKKVSASSLHSYFSETISLVWQNVDEAAIAQLKLLHRQTQIIKQNMTREDWKKVSFIVLGLHLPRQDNILAQYFTKLLQVPRVNDRVVYGENLSTEQQALDLMARVKIDTVLGEVVFNEKYRMHRDLLGDAAKDYLSPAEKCQ